MQRYTYLIICLIIFSHLGILAQSGNVGIGASSPISKLHIRSSQPALTLESILPLNISAGSETISSIIFRGQKNNLFRDAAYITAKQNGTWSSSSLTFAPTSLHFFTQSFGSADGLASPRMVISSTGNLGVGVESPRVLLHISKGSPGTFTSSGGTTSLFESDTENYVSLFNPEQYASGIYFGFPSDPTSGGVLYNANNTQRGLQFRTNGNASRMVIDSLGRVGIGTSSPRSRLHTHSSQPAFTLESNLPLNNTAGSQIMSRIIFRGQKNNLFRDAAYITAVQNGTWSSVEETLAPSSLQFFTQSGVSADALASPRMIISSGGNVGIGTASPKQRLHITKGAAGTFASSANTTAVFESNTDNYVSLMNPEANSSGILFENPTNQNTAGIIYNDSIRRGLQIYANDKDPSIYIDNFANVGINDAAPNASLSIKAKNIDFFPLKVKDPQGTEIFEVKSNGTAGIHQRSDLADFTIKANHMYALNVKNSQFTSLFTIKNDGHTLIGDIFSEGSKLAISNAEGFNEVVRVLDDFDNIIMQNSNDGTSDFFGQVTKPLGSFKIDHPLDPENKYLYHSFVESPDMMNIYNGNITTDAEGRATVDLPDYFEALNMEFRYQLTVIGSFAQAIIQEEVKENQFVIATNEPNVKVSWQVTGIRHDPYANEHRIPNSIDKAPEDKGTYLYPEVYGKPATQSERYLNQESE